MSKKGWLTKALLYAFSLIGVVSIMVGIGGAYLFYKKTNLTPTEFINKAAAKSGLTKGNDELFASKQQYTNQFQYLALNQQFPRILNKEYAVVKNPHEYFRQHFELLKANKERVALNCKSSSYFNKLACFLYNGDTDPSAFEALRGSLIDFTLDEPRESGYYGNGWSFAYIYDISRAVAQFDEQTINQIDNRIAVVLEVYLKKLDRKSASLWHGRASLASTAILLASVLDLDKPSNKALYSRSYGHFLDLMNAVEVVGTWPEGYNYWIQNRAHLIVLGLSAMLNHPSSKQSQRAHNMLLEIGYSHIYLTRPDNQIEGYADEGSRIDLKEETRKVIDIIAKTTGNNELLMYSNWLKQLHPRATYYRDYRWMLPYFVSAEMYTPTHQLTMGVEQHLADFNGLLPNAKLFGKGFSNHAVIRSGWDKNDTFITFRASNIYTHHQHYDAGHFTLFKGAPLITNSGTYGAYTSEHRLNYAIRTVAKNSLLIMQPNEHDSLLGAKVNDGGQRVIMPTGSSISSYQEWLKNITNKEEFLATEFIDANLDNEEIQSISVDIADAYNDRSMLTSNTKVKEAIRQLVYLPNEDSLLVKDSVMSASPNYTVKSLLHMYNKPVIYGEEELVAGSATNGILRGLAGQFETHNKNASLYADFVWPIDPKLQIIGGPNYQYYVDIDGDDNTIDGQNMILGAKSESFYELPLWRVELMQQQESEHFDSLMVLQPRLENEPKKAINYYLREPNLTVFSLGSTLVVLGNNITKYNFIARQDINNVVVLMGSKTLKFRLFTSKECQLINNVAHTAVSKPLNVKKGANVNLFVSAIYDGENQC